MDSLETETWLGRTISHIGIQTHIALSQIGSTFVYKKRVLYQEIYWGMPDIPPLRPCQTVGLHIYTCLNGYHSVYHIISYHHVDPNPAAFHWRLVPALLRSLQRYGLACAVVLTTLGQGVMLDTCACDSKAAGVGWNSHG